ncbi:erythromycin resistance leader peptide [Corynebacterium accolens]
MLISGTAFLRLRTNS